MIKLYIEAYRYAKISSFEELVDPLLSIVI
jgi:hypothetical protein